MSESINASDFCELELIEAGLLEADERIEPLTREDYARRGAELFANENIAMVRSPITSPDDLIPVIIEEKESCFKIALRYTGGDWDAAEDIYQKALVNAYLNLKSGEPIFVSRKMVNRIQLDDEQVVNPKARLIVIKKPAAWLHTIIRNTGRNEYLHRRATRKLLDKLEQDLERESYRFEQPETGALRNISNEELRKIVDCLPGLWAEIINLHYFEGFEYEEIAEKLKRPSSTVRVSAMRALSMLKDVLQGKRDVRDGRIGRPKTSGNHCPRELTDKKAG